MVSLIISTLIEDDFGGYPKSLRDMHLLFASPAQRLIGEKNYQDAELPFLKLLNL